MRSSLFLLMLMVNYALCHSINECLIDALVNVTTCWSSQCWSGVLDNHAAQGISIPLVLVGVHSVGDVVTSVRAAKACGCVVCILGGGHGAVGQALCNGVVIDMKRMANVATGAYPSSVEVQTGARFRDLYGWLLENTPSGTAVVGGGCPQVGIGGFLQGGGYSFISRSNGMAIDQLLSGTVVLADGQVVVVNATGPYADLFWAMRGGGGGNFGVLVQATLATVQTGAPEILIGQLCFDPWVNVAQLWATWEDIMSRARPSLTLDGGWLPLGSNGTRLLCFTCICNDGSADYCTAAVQPFVNLNPVLNTLKFQNFMQWSYNHEAVTDAQSGRLYLTSVLLPAQENYSDLFDALGEYLRKSPSSKSLVLTHSGLGAISTGQGSFPWRGAKLVLQIKAIWENPADDAVNVEWVRVARDKFLARAAHTSYINYMDPLVPTAAFYGNSWADLIKAKCRYDPNGLFVSFSQSLDCVGGS